MKAIRALLLSAIVSACADSMTAPGPSTPPGPVTATVSYCAGLEPLWVAFQDGDGAWTRALPTVSDGMTVFQFAFASNRSGISEIYVSGTNGENPQRLTNFPSGAEQPAWSPDGNWLAFVGYTGDAQGENRRELYLLFAADGQGSSDGAGLIRLTQNAFDDTEPTWLGQ